MNLQQYVPLALRTEKPFPMPIDRLVHAALGIDTETGELNTIIKRAAIYGKSLDEQLFDAKGKPFTLRQHAGEEIGDAFWYCAIIIDVLKIDPNQVAPFPSTTIYPLDQLALRLASYSGRVADIIVVAKAQGKAELPQGDVNYLVNALANLLRLLGAACYALDLDIYAVMDANIAKLRERFADKYSDEAAEARLDKGGLDAHQS